MMDEMDDLLMEVCIPLETWGLSRKCLP
jgi:hypothetical protein